MDDDDGTVARIPTRGGGFLSIGHREDRVTIAAHEVEVQWAARVEIALDEAVAQARAWADGQAASA